MLRALRACGIVKTGIHFGLCHMKELNLRITLTNNYNAVNAGKKERLINFVLQACYKRSV